MDPQAKSQFFSFPVEIRDSIYAYLVPNVVHVFMRECNAVMSTCLEPNIGADFSGWERKPDPRLDDRSDADAVWGRRLRSSWGPHWQCEDVAQTTTVMALFSVCKRMCMDISDVLASNNVVFHVTDLHTLDHLARSLSPSQYGMPAPDFRYIRMLHITLRLPLPFFQALASNATTTSSSDNIQAPLHRNAAEPDPVDMWLKVWPALALRLQHLQHLHLWLDHGESRPWYHVDERTVLSPLFTSVSSTNIVGLQDITVHLPNLHPLHENPVLHFTKGSSPPPACATIKRRVRQRHFYDETAAGDGGVVYEEDFPMLFELVELHDSPFHREEGLSITREELEDMERGLWERGETPNMAELMWAFGPTCELLAI